MYNIEDLIGMAAGEGASDVHLIAGLPPKCRIDGQVMTLTEGALSHEDCEEYGRQLAGEHLKRIAEIGQLDFSATIAGGRIRINLFRQQGCVSAAIRLLADHIPSLEELSLPPVVADFAAYRSGIVLVTGETGSGKSTTLAALLDRINHSSPGHIITLEDPIEYLHQHKMSMVNQREIGIDSNNYANALRAALREDPDVILVGEMRDFETISVAITAAETGHLVLSTLHTIGAASTVDRVIDVFPPHQQQQIRVQLSNTLEAVISQQLIPTADGKHRVAAFEVMHANHAVRNLIREGKSHQLASVMQTNRKLGMITMDEAIVQLYFEGKIDREQAIQFAQDPDSMENKI